MPNPASISGHQDTALLGKLALIERTYLAVVVVIAAGALWMGQSSVLGWHVNSTSVPVTPEVAVALLLSALGLELSRPRHPEGLKRAGVVVAVLLAAVAGSVLAGNILHIPIAMSRLMGGAASGAQPMPSMTAGAFLALAVIVVLTPARKGAASHAADFFVSVFWLLVLAMVRQYLFEGLSSRAAVDRTSLLTLLAFALLAFVALMHRAERGIFSTLLGAGSGSRIARVAAPMVLLVPFLPRAALENAVRSGWLSAPSLTAAVEFVVAAAILTLMLYMALKINRLEEKIRDLALRDELTGLVNRRGFHLVGWQVLRQARRDGLAFSILFVELENLVEIQRALGPDAGEEALIEMGELMTAAFRATDVIGRVDPAQFAMAGHFDEANAVTVKLRLKEAINYRNANPGRTYSLRAFCWCVCAREPRIESLEDLMAQAEAAREREAQDAEAARSASRNAV